MRCLLTVLLSLVLSLAISGTASAAQRVLVLGAISDDPNSKHETLRPIADYVENALKPFGIENVEVLIVPNRSQMVNLMRDGRIDWVSETPFAAVYLSERAGADFLARKWKDGTATYRSVFFSRKDSPVQTIEDLQDRIVAFEHRNSTTGFFIPASMMNERELALDALATPRETPRASAYGYVYSGNEYNTAMWVHKGLVHAGVLSDSDWSNPDIMPVEFLQDMNIFARSDALPRAVEMVRSGLDPKIRKALLDVLVSLHQDDAGAAALAAYDNTEKFDLLSSESLSALQDIADVLPSFRAQFP